MNIILDTDILIDALRGKQDLSPAHQYSISIISYAEILYGLKKQPHSPQQSNVFRELIKNDILHIINLDQSIIDNFTTLKIQLETTGSPLEDFDLLIAATATTHNQPLYTRNIKHFSRIRELKLFE